MEDNSVDTLRIKLNKALAGQRAKLREDKKCIEAFLKEPTLEATIAKRARGDDRFLSMFNALQDVCELVDGHWNDQDEELEKIKNLKKQMDMERAEIKAGRKTRLLSKIKDLQRRLDERNERIQKMLSIIYALRNRNGVLRDNLRVRHYVEKKDGFAQVH